MFAKRTVSRSGCFCEVAFVSDTGAQYKKKGQFCSLCKNFITHHITKSTLLAALSKNNFVGTYVQSPFFVSSILVKQIVKEHEGYL